MKSYNIQNYIRYKKDLEQSIKRIPKKEYIDYTREELNKLNSTNGIFVIRESISSAQGSIPLDSELLTQLQDRLPAVALLAEAQSHNLSVGKFHEFVRLFEYAFALPFRQVKKKLLPNNNYF